MKTKPILFSTPMVQAILKGRKTQTRRIIPEKIIDDYYNYDEYCNMVMPSDIPCTRTYEKEFYLERCKYSINDILWVRETFQHTKCLNLHPSDDNYGYIYKADSQPWEDYENWKWKPSIFMPKEATRIFLKVTDIRVERLHDISESDIKNEGVIWSHPFANEKDCSDFAKFSNYYDLWKELWVKINGLESWDENSFVWVYEFERTEKPENFIQ